MNSYGAEESGNELFVCNVKGCHWCVSLSLSSLFTQMFSYVWALVYAACNYLYRLHTAHTCTFKRFASLPNLRCWFHFNAFCSVNILRMYLLYVILIAMEFYVRDRGKNPKLFHNHHFQPSVTWTRSLVFYISDSMEKYIFVISFRAVDFTNMNIWYGIWKFGLYTYLYRNSWTFLWIRLNM